MRKCLMIILMACSLGAYANDVDKIDTDTRCIGGYLFAIAAKEKSHVTTIAMVQVFRPGDCPQCSPQPIPCK